MKFHRTTLALCMMAICLWAAPHLAADTPKASPAKPMEARVYDVAELLVETPDFPGELCGIYDWRGNRNRFGGLFSGMYQSELGPTRGEQVDELQSYLQATIDPESWGKGRGELFVIGESDPLLLITQTPANHDAIAKALLKWREVYHSTITVD